MKSIETYHYLYNLRAWSSYQNFIYQNECKTWIDKSWDLFTSDVIFVYSIHMCVSTSEWYQLLNEVLLKLLHRWYDI